MASPITGGEALFGKGFQWSRFSDDSQGQPGRIVTIPFQYGPSDPVRRYGTNLVAMSWPPEQYTGGHSTARRSDGLRNADAVALLPQIFSNAPPRGFGIAVEANAQRDQTDLDFLVNGSGYPATQWVLDKAIEFGMVALPAPPPVVQPPAAPPPSPPVVMPPPPVVGLHPLSPASVRAEELRSLAFWVPKDGINTMLDWLPGQTDSGFQDWARTKPFVVEALRVLRRLRAKLGDTREIPMEDR